MSAPAAVFAVGLALAATYADAVSIRTLPAVAWPLPAPPRAPATPSPVPQRGGWSLEDADWAAVTAIEEAPLEGRVAVVWVIRRRMRACACRAQDVVLARMQFQPWRQGGKAGRMLRRLEHPNRETIGGGGPRGTGPPAAASGTLPGAPRTSTRTGPCPTGSPLWRGRGPSGGTSSTDGP